MVLENRKLILLDAAGGVCGVTGMINWNTAGARKVYGRCSGAKYVETGMEIKTRAF